MIYDMICLVCQASLGICLLPSPVRCSVWLLQSHGQVLRQVGVAVFEKDATQVLKWPFGLERLSQVKHLANEELSFIWIKAAHLVVDHYEEHPVSPCTVAQEQNVTRHVTVQVKTKLLSNRKGNRKSA